MLYKVKNKKTEKKIAKYDKKKKVIFVSQAALNMCWTRLICKFVLNRGNVPVNYFTAFGHFVYEIADPQTMIDSINALIVRCNELWAFGEITEGMWEEINMCKKLGLKVRYFNIAKLPKKIFEIKESEVIYGDKFLQKIKRNNRFVPIEKIKANQIVT